MRTIIGAIDRVRDAVEVVLFDGRLPPDLAVRAAETVAVVGESGSGKSSLVRSALGLVPATAGRVVLCGEALPPDVNDRSLETRRGMQLVFQDPAGSLNPQLRVERIVAEPLTVHAPESSATFAP